MNLIFLIRNQKELLLKYVTMARHWFRLGNYIIEMQTVCSPTIGNIANQICSQTKLYGFLLLVCCCDSWSANQATYWWSSNFMICIWILNIIISNICGLGIRRIVWRGIGIWQTIRTFHHCENVIIIISVAHLQFKVHTN